MSWMAKLYDTYEAGLLLDLPEQEQLMPICHILQNAHINITIDEEGNFKRAEILEKTQVVLPATEKSAGRSSGEAPHPLTDKIQYVAKDYVEYGGQKKGYFLGYLSELEKWCNSPFPHPKAIAIRNYVKKGTVIQDLVLSKLLVLDEHGYLLCPTIENLRNYYDDSDLDRPKIFSVINKDDKTKRFDQGNALVCWSVEEKRGNPISGIWRDSELQKAWIDYVMDNSKKAGLCFITGKKLPLAVNHPAKLRHTGDKAKLVSSNDITGFTFRGRFTDSKNSVENDGLQAVGISFVVTQKVHNALRWLISRQGYRNGDQVVVAWAVSGNEIPQPLEDIWDHLGDDIQETSIPYTEAENVIDHTIDLGQSYSIALRKYMAGYQASLKVTDNIIIMGLDSATSGRMAVTYYQEIFPEDYINRISKWYDDFSWHQRHKFRETVVWSIGTPSPRSIWTAVYGTNLSESLKKNTVERILPCIVEARSFPRDLVENAVRKASNRSAFRSDEQWLWEQNLGIACSLYRGFCKRNTRETKEYMMGLELDNNSRDYLYGRLLAIAERLEDVALYVAKENRSTTAARLMQRFADRPASTWRNIELALQPYSQRLKNQRTGFLRKIQFLLDEVMNKFDQGEFTNDKPLSGEFLLAYHSQRLELRKKTTETIENFDSQTDGDEV